MLISVVVPCHNAEKTIADTIRSALAQDVEREVIVIDDGSTDGSASVISSFGPQIRVERRANAGVSAARNRGGELARGNFLQYLDSDDQLAPGTLRRRRDALISTNADAAYTNWQKLVEEGRGGVSLSHLRFRCSNCGSSRSGWVVTSRYDDRPGTRSVETDHWR